MRVHKIIEKTYAEGPGSRFCIWVQGCNQRCKGCFATELWDYDKGYEIEIYEILKLINNVKDEIDGITFLGGEPFDKAKDLYKIAEYIHSLNKNVITFTGYKYEQIKSSKNQDFENLLNYTDLLIDGKFKVELLDFSRPLVGSSNQRFIFLTNRISKEEIKNYKNRFELRLDGKGKMDFNGMGDTKILMKFLNKLSPKIQERNDHKDEK